MPEAVSDEDLEKIRERNEKLREQIAAAEAVGAENLQAHNNLIEAGQLMSETARLEAQLAAAKAAAKITTIREGASGLTDSIDDQLKAAEAAAAAPPGPIDPNISSDEKKSGGN